jgi:hypothetical protein
MQLPDALINDDSPCQHVGQHCIILQSGKGSSSAVKHGADQDQRHQQPIETYIDRQPAGKRSATDGSVVACPEEDPMMMQPDDD